MSDPTKRPLQLPAWQIPYLEKHKIYELFHEIAKELVIQKPNDHVLFMKQILHNAASSKDVPRILILNTPHVNTFKIAKVISEKTGHVIISNADVERYLGEDIGQIPSHILVKCLVSLVRSQNCYKLGWIMVDCIRDEEDAKLLLRAGVLPTHTILNVAPLNHDINSLIYCNVKSSWPDYRRKITATREVFKNTLIEVHLKEKQVSQVAEEIIAISKNRKQLSPGIKRVVILGPRGCGRKTQAKLLVENFNLVHVDFEYLLCSSWISPTELGDRLRNCRNEVCFHSQLLAQVVNKRILEEDCLRNGWVLTGFPFTCSDFKYLDSLDTPPNRVIFIECDVNICKERLTHRKINVYTNSSTNMLENSSLEREKIYKSHPKDELDMVNAELNFFCENYGSLRKYCGGTASYVNGNQSERFVFEIISAILLREAPGGPPRDGIRYLNCSSSSSSDSCGCVPLPQHVADCFIRKL